MGTYLRIDINLTAMVLLGMVLYIAALRLDRKEPLNRLFVWTSGIVMLQLFFETATCVINRHAGDGWLFLSILLHVSLFITAPILTCFWCVFLHSWIVPEDTGTAGRRLLMAVPVVMNGILVVASVFTGWMFYFDTGNVYHRGPLFVFASLITYSYLLIGLHLIFRHRKRIVHQEFLPMFVFGFLPLFGGLIQTLFYGVLLMWSGTAFSLIIVYIFLQQRMVQRDQLTGVWSRDSFDRYILQRAEHGGRAPFGVIFVDMDGLKAINDTYGHYEGDSAIQTTVLLVRQALRADDTIARFGGDEFVIAVNCAEAADLWFVMARIEDNFRQFNREMKKPYVLECSFGGDLYDSKVENIEPFLVRVDQRMYQSKRLKKKSFTNADELNRRVE